VLGVFPLEKSHGEVIFSGGTFLENIPTGEFFVGVECVGSPLAKNMFNSRLKRELINQQRTAQIE